MWQVTARLAADLPAIQPNTAIVSYQKIRPGHFFSFGAGFLRNTGWRG